jgi:hypothetical protein
MVSEKFIVDIFGYSKVNSSIIKWSKIKSWRPK